MGIMRKLMTAAGVAVLSLSLAGLGYAGQGKTDASNPNMGSDQGSQPDTGKSATQSEKKRKPAGKAAGESMDPKNSGTKTPPISGEGSNPTLDSTGKGGTSGG